VDEPYQNLLAAMLARDAARRPAISEVLNRLTAEGSSAV
jgi:hypothetical protein